MLTQLHFKNWHSLRDVTISDLTPITVFIGANSSGKTNILDALHFVRESIDRNIGEAFAARNWDVHTLTSPQDEPILLEFSFEPDASRRLRYDLLLQPTDHKGAVQKLFETEPYSFSERLLERLADNRLELKMRSSEGRIETYSTEGVRGSRSRELGLSALGRTNDYPDIQSAFEYITERWQLLAENFMPKTNVRDSQIGSFYTSRMQPNADNTTPQLVADFAARLAKRLIYPFSERLRRPKTIQNSAPCKIVTSRRSI